MRDGKGNNHKAAGRPDGGQFDRKAGQGSDDDLDMVPAFDPKHLTDDDILALRHAKGAELEAASSGIAESGRIDDPGASGGGQIARAPRAG